VLSGSAHRCIAKSGLGNGDPSRRILRAILRAA
jgi:hypothetical protein